MRIRLSALILAAVAAARALGHEHGALNRLNRAQHPAPLAARQQTAEAGSPTAIAPPSSGMTLATSFIATAVSAVSSTVRAPPPTSLPKPPNPVPRAPPNPAPTPLDTSISSTLSSGCMTYLTNLLSNSTFLSCLPFSLLLQMSKTYTNQVTSATTTGNYTFLNELLAYANSPQPGGEQCDKAYSDFRAAMGDKANCGTDLAEGKPVARQARRGISNYAVLRTAAGLIDPDSGSYCYLEAVASERPDDLYLWMLPMGNILPASSSPTCSKCSALVMNHFGTWSGNTTTLNATVLTSAASTINTKCGANFVSVAAQTATSSSPPRRDLLLSVVAFVPFLAWAFIP